MYGLALKNLLTNLRRVLLTQAGVAFAVMLVLVQVGMFVGIMRNSSAVIDHSVADFWIVSKRSPNFDFGRSFPDRFLHVVRSTPGIRRAETLEFGWTGAKLPDGSSEKVELIGYHPEAGPGWGAPWELAQGGLRSVLGGEYMIADISAEKRLGPIFVGKRLEVGGRDVRIRGVTNGIRAITSSPYLFTSYDTASKIVEGAAPGQTVFILAQAEPGADLALLREELQKRLPFLDVLTREQYSDRSRYYWSIKTGVGLNFVLNAILGLIVGVSVVAQVVYSDTMERQRDYAVLRALGATNAEVISLLGLQAVVNSVMGFTIGGALAVMAQALFDYLYLSVALPAWLWAGVAVVTLGMCLGGSLTSVQKVIRLDPGMVFGGP